MPSYTANLRLIQPTTGEYPGTWGIEANNGLTAVVDKAVAGTTTITMTAADYTLANANGVADEAKSMFLVLEGTPGAAFNVICPSTSKLYFVTNNTGFAQTVKTSTGTGVSVPNGASMALRCDGVNVIEALSYTASPTFADLTYTGLLTGGTGVINIGSGQFYKDASGNIGLNTTAPTSRLTISGTGLLPAGLAIESTSTTSARPPILAFRRTTTASNSFVGQISFLRLLTDGSSNEPVTIFAGGTNNAASPVGSLYFNAITNYYFRINNVDKLTIDNSVIISYTDSFITSGSFSVKGPVGVASATYTVVDSDYSVRFGLACVVTLPSPSLWPGRILIFNNTAAVSVTSASSNVIPLGGTVPGTSILSATAGKFAQLQSNGTSWVILMAN